ncbi:MAG TPA: BMP family ABC transporter substrate-binding protein [Conexibacter sp.]|nr:BMP family ABC transporter substrate-binding protein [Conexibacter sp.]
MALAVVVALAIVAAGCGSEGGTPVKKIAFVAPYGDNEPDWTLRAQEVVREFPRALGVRADTADASQTRDIRGVLEQVSHEHNQLVIAHDSRYADAAEAVANETRVPELVWGERPHAKKGLVGQITLQDKEAGYMAGVVAAHAAITRRLAVIVLADGSDWDLATWNRMAGGFVAGARGVDPAEQIHYVQVGDNGSATIEQVHDAALRLLRSGAQMIFALGGKSTLGALRAVEQQQGENQFIGVISDKAAFNRENFVLESIMFDPRPVFVQAVEDIRRGRFAQHPYELTLRNRGLWILHTGRTPEDAYEDALRVQGRIERGQVHVPAASTREAVEALIAGRTPQS